MSKLTDYKGDVMVEVSLVWFVEEKPGSLLDDAMSGEPALKHKLCWIGTDRIESIIITKRGLDSLEYKKPIGQPLAGIDKRDRPICNQDRASYTLGPINTHDLQGLIDDKKISVELRWSYREIFELILREWQSSASKTLASRTDDDPLLTAIIEKKDLKRNKLGVPFKYRELRTRAKVDADILDYKVEESKGGSPPSVQLVVQLDPADSVRDTFGRMMCAAEWTSLSAYDAKEQIKTKAIPRGLTCGFLNIQRWIAASVIVERGRKMYGSIVNGAKYSTDAKDLVTSVRATIDKYMIAANHWGEARETLTSSDPIERYQARMSSFFGMLYEKHTLASPVNLARGMFAGSRDFGIRLFDSDRYGTPLWLQLGVGHCGEHALVGYDVFRGIMKANPNSPIENAILSGNANIDHEFVLVNLKVDFVFETRVLNKHNKLFSVGTPVFVLDLKHALAQPGNGDALVHDAYLQYSRFETKASKLLHSLQHKNNKALNTTFVRYTESTPGTPDNLSLLDLSDDELRKECPNI